jgi:hypothetical protein
MFFIKIFSIVSQTFFTGKDAPSNVRLNSTVITFCVCICLIALCFFTCKILYNTPEKFNDVIIYFGGLLTTFLSFAITGKLIQKKIEIKKDTENINNTEIAKADPT